MNDQDFHGTARRSAAWAIGIFILVFGALGTALTLRAGAAAQDPLTDAFYKVCWDCHDPDRIRQARRTRVEWEDIIYQMIDRGAVGSDQDFSLVLQYLLRDYGRVNVNQSTSAELALVLDLSAKEAEALVAHREANGPFKDFEALLKVPGLDAKKLEEHRAAILF
jgi:competence protein ComEA